MEILYAHCAPEIKVFETGLWVVTYGATTPIYKNNEPFNEPTVSSSFFFCSIPSFLHSNQILILKILAWRYLVRPIIHFHTSRFRLRSLHIKIVRPPSPSHSTHSTISFYTFPDEFFSNPDFSWTSSLSLRTGHTDEHLNTTDESDWGFNTRDVLAEEQGDVPGHGIPVKMPKQWWKVCSSRISITTANYFMPLHLYL